MAYLSIVSLSTFQELKGRVKATDGNLSAHISKPERVGYVRVETSFEGKRPVTRVDLTDAGRASWIACLYRLKALLDGSLSRPAMGDPLNL
jgi:DNA-binding MarR family transcriptional regulator